jgi:hypothetical protein
VRTYGHHFYNKPGESTPTKTAAITADEGGIIPNFDGSDPLDADVIEAYVGQEFPDDRLKRLLFRHCCLFVKWSATGGPWVTSMTGSTTSPSCPAASSARR